MFGKKKYNYKSPNTSKKKSFIQAALGAYLPKKETSQEKRTRLEEEYEGLKLEGRNLRAKNFVEREKNTYKKLTGSIKGGGGAPGVPDYLNMGGSHKSSGLDPILFGKGKKSKSYFEI